MTKQDKYKLLKTISEKLIPTILELQKSNMFNKKLELKINSQYCLEIHNNSIYSLQKENNKESFKLAILRTVGQDNVVIYAGETKNQLLLTEIENWKFGNNILLESENVILNIANKLIEHIKEAEKQQEEINNIFDYANKIALPLSKID
jgi:arginine deiminase